MTMETKRCTKCGRELPVSEFHKTKDSKDGHYWWCKSCRKIQSKEYYEQHKEIVLSRNKEWNKNNIEKCREAVRRYEAKNKGRSKLRAMRYKLMNELSNQRVSTKVCKCCGKELPIECFRKHIYIKDGFSNVCKDCRINTDAYFSEKLHKSGFPKEYITPDLIAFKRAHLQLKREIKAQESQEPK